MIDRPTDIEAKPDVEIVENVDEGDLGKHRDEERVLVTLEDNNRIKRMIDKRILVIPCLGLPPSNLGQASHGLWQHLRFEASPTPSDILITADFCSIDTRLTGGQYGLAATMNNIAQLCWMPFSAYLVVRVPARILMPALIFGWGTAAACMAASNSFASLCATRFLLGLFEAGCLPLFSVITAHWYRRSEQPIRICAWYSTNGVAQIIAAVGSFAIGKIQSPAIKSWQLIFLLVGLITVITAPVVYLFLDSDISSARFLSDTDKEKAIERVRANQTGAGSTEFKWPQVWELAYDPKTYLFGGLALCLNFGASVSTAFGPTLIRGFGFETDVTALLNAPFGAMQLITIWGGSLASQYFRLKGVILVIVCLPVITGIALLYQTNLQPEINRAQALAGYYMLASLFAGNPLIVSWLVANTAGQTKKSAILSVYNAFNAVGSIVGPLLFNANDAPRYLPGIRATLGVFSAMIGIIGICYMLLLFLNKQREGQREAVGKPAKIKDTSMSKKYETYGREGGLGENAGLDLTDFKNNEFVYVY